MLKKGERVKTTIDMPTEYKMLESMTGTGSSLSGSEWIHCVEEDRLEVGGGMQTSRSWMWRTGERRSHSWVRKEVLRRYGEREQRRRGEMSMAKMIAKKVYMQAAKENSGTGTDSRNYNRSLARGFDMPSSKREKLTSIRSAS